MMQTDILLLQLHSQSFDTLGIDSTKYEKFQNLLDCHRNVGLSAQTSLTY